MTLIPKVKPSLWLLAGTVSLVLLVGLITQLDFASFWLMVRGMEPIYLGLALLLLFTEGTVTALRLILFANNGSRIGSGLLTNAWYSVLIVVLPARLGEVAAILLLQKYLKQNRAAALMSILVQRLFDLVILSSLFFIAITSLVETFPANLSRAISITVIGLAVLLIYKMDWFLSLAANLVLRRKRPNPHSARRWMLRFLLQARVWRRHSYQLTMTAKALFLTTVKWCCTLGAISCLFLALHTPLSLTSGLVASAAYNFIAVVPIQTIGGLGLGEVGLALILVGMGLGKSTAVGISLFTRMILIVFPFLFLGVVTGLSLIANLFNKPGTLFEEPHG